MTTGTLERTGFARFEAAKAKYPKPRTDLNDWADRPDREAVITEMLTAFTETRNVAEKDKILGFVIGLCRSDYPLNRHVGECALTGRLHSVRLDSFHWSMILDRVNDQAASDNDCFGKMLPAIKQQWVGTLKMNDLVHFAHVTMTEGIAAMSG